MECWPPKMKIVGKDCTQLAYLFITNTITTNSEIPLSIDLIRQVLIAFFNVPVACCSGGAELPGLQALILLQTGQSEKCTNSRLPEMQFCS